MPPGNSLTNTNVVFFFSRAFVNVCGSKRTQPLNNRRGKKDHNPGKKSWEWKFHPRVERSTSLLSTKRKRNHRICLNGHGIFFLLRHLLDMNVPFPLDPEWKRRWLMSAFDLHLLQSCAGNLLGMTHSGAPDLNREVKSNNFLRLITCRAVLYDIKRPIYRGWRVTDRALATSRESREKGQQKADKRQWMEERERERENDI